MQNYVYLFNIHHAQTHTHTHICRSLAPQRWTDEKTSSNTQPTWIVYFIDFLPGRCSAASARATQRAKTVVLWSKKNRFSVGYMLAVPIRRRPVQPIYGVGAQCGWTVPYWLRYRTLCEQHDTRWPKSEQEGPILISIDCLALTSVLYHILERRALLTGHIYTANKTPYICTFSVVPASVVRLLVA